MSLARVLLPLCSWLLLAVFQWPGYAARPSDDFSFLVTTSRPWPDPEFNDDEFQSDAPTTGTANTDIFEWTSVGDDTTTETPSEPTVWTEETTGMETQESTTTLLEGTTSPEGATRTTTADEDGTPPSEEAADTEAPEAVPSLTLADSEALPMADRELPPPKVHKLKIKSDIRFRYASTLVHSRVANPANKSQEVVFKVVLPESAFISRFLIEVQGKVFEGYVKEKRAAHKDYQSAVTAGQTAAHIGVSPRNTGVFSVSLNMEPRSKVTFNLTYEELLSRKLGTYNHVVNVNPGQVVPDLDVDVYIRETRHITVLRIPEFRSFAEGNEAKKEYTENSLAKISRYSDRKVRIRFSPTSEQQKELSRDQSGDEGLGGQLVVQYDVDRSQQAGEILVIDGYFVHFFAPTNLKSLQKHVIFVLDTSGSMWGRKIQQLQEAMVTILDNMKRGDYFSLVKFSTTVTEWSPQNKEKNYGVHPVNRKNVDKAKKYILSMEATGATNIHGALRKALDIASRRSNTTDPRDLPEPMVIFLTDGLPTVGEVKPSKIHSSVRTHNTENKIPVFSLAFGEGANFKFLKKLSLQNFGFARKIFEAADAPMQLLGFFSEVASPLLSNVSFSYVEAKIDVQSLTQRTFHTFYEGSEVVVAGKLRDPETQPDQLQGEVTGTTGGQTIQLHSADPFPLQQLPVTTPSPTRLTRQASFIEKLWAYLTVRQLLDKAVEDQPEDLLDLEGLFDYAELEGEEDQLSPKQKAIKTALEYGFVTPFTSLVVVKPDKTNGISETPTEVMEAPTSDFPDSSQMQNKIIPVPMPGRRPTLSNDTPTRLTGPGSSTEASEDGGYEEEDTEIDVNGNLSLKDVTWLPQYLNSSGLLILRNASDEEGEIYKIDEWQIPQFNDGFEACVTAAGASGNCRHISVCVLPQFVDDYTAFLEYFCPIGSYVGVCCPKSAYDARRTEDKEFYTTEEPTTLVSYDEQV